MDKILELLGAEKLNESSQSEIKEQLQTIIEVKAKELSKANLTEEKETLVKEYEEKFEEYKGDITGKFSNFVDSVLDEEMTLPEKVVEYARKGELYTDLIEQFKTRLAIDEGLLDEEVKGLLREAKDEIVKLREELDDKIAENLELKKDAQELAAALYLRKKCDGLTEAQKSKVIEVLEGISDREEIDKKFDIILKTLKVTEQEEEEEEEEEEDESSDKDKTDEGKGVSEVNNDELNENGGSPFDDYIKQYVSVLKEGI